MSRKNKTLLLLYAMAALLPPLGALTGLALFVLRRLKPHGLMMVAVSVGSMWLFYASWHYWNPPATSDIETLTRRLRHLRESVRAQAADRLGGRQDPRAVRALVRALEDRSARVRHVAASSLGETADPAAIDPLARLLSDPDDGVAASAARALGRIGDPRAITALTARLDSESETARRDASLALASAGDRAAEEALVRRALSGDAAVAAGAYPLLISLGGTRLEGVLADALQMHGSRGMAQDYLNCGNAALELAAREWARTHGVSVQELSQEGYGARAAAAALIGSPPVWGKREAPGRE
jgi:hypothetical protein